MSDQQQQQQQQQPQAEDMQVEPEANDPQPEEKFNGQVLDSKEYAAASKLLFGGFPNELDVQRWHSQGFVFSERKQTLWGLTQSYGGPCGILAPTQGFVLVDLLFSTHKISVNQEEVKSGVTVLSPTNEQRNAALVRSLANIIDRARSSDSKLIIAEGALEGKKLNQIYTQQFSSKEEVEKYYSSNSDMLTSSVGVLLFVYSVLLTRTLQAVKDDMDDLEMPLVARFGHCSQELVNLILTGRAVTNVFDGNKDMGGLILNGIDKQGPVGYITLLEALRYSKVGRFLKSPENPVWVVGSSSHYTVMFSVDEKVGKVSEAETMEQNARAAFNELDPQEIGFVSADKLSVLLNKLGYQGDVNAARGVMVTDGIILWDSVKRALRMLRGEPEPSNVVASHPPGPWSCGACTFMNESGNSCSICGTPRPAPQSPPSTGGHPSPFTLFHFNGISNHNSAVETCSRVQVTLLGEGVRPTGSTQKRGLREVIQTRWSSGLVEYQADVPAPKIV